MYREYKKEVYDVKKMWTQQNEVVHPETKQVIVVDAETSFEAQREMQAQRENLSALSAMDTDELADMQKMTQFTIANMEFKRLYDVRNPDGTLKTGKDLEKVLVRKKYRTESSKFYENINFEKTRDSIFKDSSCFSEIKDKIFSFCSLFAFCSKYSSLSLILVFKTSNTISNFNFANLSSFDVLVKKDFFGVSLT